MMQYDRIALGRQAKKLGFVRDTFEKVCRLTDVLRFMESETLLSDSLALKGGTAINLTIFDLPRLSVDIDLDFTRNIPRDAMLEERRQIVGRIQKYMAASGYRLSEKSKQYHALDSFVYEYTNAGGMKDNLKIEINYMLRCHILPITQRQVKLSWLAAPLTVFSVAPLEIFASKIVALINRTAPRDLYDIFNLQKYQLFHTDELQLLRKCAVFYSAIAADQAPDTFHFDAIYRLSPRQIKTDLTPVLRRGEHFDLETAQNAVQSYLAGFLTPNAEELRFWDLFNQGNYQPDLIFSKPEYLAAISDHPMALWKCRGEQKDTGKEM